MIDRYADLCSSCSMGKTHTLLLCSNGNEKTASSHSEVIDEPLLDYTSFESFQEFEKVKTLLRSRIAFVVTRLKIQYPVVILFHNVSLGKNVAASAAFTETARRFGNDNIRFFSVVHDFAEEGRTDMLDIIGSVRVWRKTIDEELHCVGAPVTYIVPGKRSFDILSRLKFPVQLLPNSIAAIPVKMDKELLCAQLVSLANKQGCSFDISKPVWYCSSRIIHRKNILETVLLSRLLDTALILGPEGTSSSDRILVEELYSIARKYRLNLLVNPAKCSYFINQHNDVVSAMYTLSSAAVTTSVAEGFGFGLYEPYFHNRPLLGRRPPGFAYPFNIKTDNLYDILPVPVEYVNKQLLIKRYYEKFGNNENVDKKADYIVNANILDFADLDVHQQKKLLGRFLEDPAFQNTWIRALCTEYPGWPGLHQLNHNAVKAFMENQAIFLDFFSRQNEQERFRSTFSSIPYHANQPVEYWSIKDAFAAEGLSLLL